MADKGYKSIERETDPKTGTRTWDIIYKPDYSLVFTKFKDFIKAYEKFLRFEETRSDEELGSIFNTVKNLFNKFRKNIREKHPEDYKKLKSIEEQQVKELIRKTLDEMSATGAGAGAGHFSPGAGAQYATPNAFNPNKKAKGAQNIYYYKLGWKDVPVEKLHKQSKAIDHKDLWKKKLEEETSQQYVDSLNLQDPSLKQFIGTRMEDFDKIEDKLNTLLPLLKKAKTETMNYYKTNPDFKIKYGTDLAVDYLDDLITLFKEKK
mgnify:CR=1 FL=1